MGHNPKSILERKTREIEINSYSCENNKKPLTHEEIIEDLEMRLLKNRKVVFKNETYLLRGCGEENNTGEIDVYGINPTKKEIIAIEVKRSYNWKTKTKAHHQLRKDLLFLEGKFPGFEIRLMYAYGNVHQRRKYNVELYSPKF